MEDKNSFSSSWETIKTHGTLYDQFKFSQLTRNRRKLIAFVAIYAMMHTIQTICGFALHNLYTVLQQILVPVIVVIAGVIFFAFVILLRRRNLKHWRLLLDLTIFCAILAILVYFFILHFYREDLTPSEQLELALREYIRCTCSVISIFLIIDAWWVRGLTICVTYAISIASVGHWGWDSTNIVEPALFNAMAIVGVFFFSYLTHSNETESFKEITQLFGKEVVWKHMIDRLPVGVAIIDLKNHFLFSNICFKNMVATSSTEESPSRVHAECCEPIFSRIKIRHYRDNTTKSRLNSCEDNVNGCRKPTQSKGKFPPALKEVESLNLWEFLQKNMKEPPKDAFINIYDESKESEYIFLDGTLEEKISLEISLSYTMFNGHPCISCSFNDTSYRDKMTKLMDHSHYKSFLLSSLSHEFRTPMNGSTMLLNEMQKDPSIPTDVKERYLKPVILNLKRLLLMIHSMGDYSLISQNASINLTCKSFNLRKFLKDILAIISFEVEKKKNVELQLEIDQDVPFSILSDKKRLGRVLICLLENAVKFTFQGTVRLRVSALFAESERRRSEDLDVSERAQLSQPATYLSYQGTVFSVEDTGTGMTEKQLQDLRNILRYGDFENKVSRNSTGACLGLTLANELAKTFGNELVFESQPQQGTKVSFILKNQAPMMGSSLNDVDIRERVVFSDRSSIGSLENDGRIALDINNAKSYLFDMEKLKTPNESSSAVNNHSSPGLGKFRGAFTGPQLSPQKENLFDIKDKIFDENFNFPKFGLFSFDYLAVTKCDCPRILVVDDDPFNIYSVKTIFTKHGEPIAEAYNGLEAIDVATKICEEHKANCIGKAGGLKLIMMDFNMPVMDGCQATMKLKEMMAEKIIPPISIIGCTAYDNFEIHEACLRAGMDGVEVKPISITKIKKRLTKSSNEF